MFSGANSSKIKVKVIAKKNKINRLLKVNLRLKSEDVNSVGRY